MVSFRAIFLFLLIMVERVFIIMLRGNICMFLKHEMQFLEMRAIGMFHIMEFIVYFSAWVGGKFCLKRWKIVMTFQICSLSAGLGLLGYGTMYLHQPHDFMHQLLFVSGFTLVATGHGLQLVTTLKAFDTDIIKTQTYLNHFFYLFLITDVAGFIGLTILEDYMIVLYVGGGVLVCQIFVLLVFITDKTEFDTYPGPFQEWSVYIQAYFKHLVNYASENVESRKTFKETKKERKMRLIKELLLKRKKLMLSKQGPKVHFLDIAIPKYGLEFVNDVKLKWRFRSLMLILPVVWIGIELQYSYWLLSVYRMDRVSFLKPTQLILAVNGIVTFLFMPIFALLINSILKFAQFNTGMHRMVIGGFFIVLAVFLGLNNINTQEAKRQKANEPYFNQVKQMVINGINCNLSFNEKVHVEYQQSFDMKTSGPTFKQVWRPPTKRKRFRRAAPPEVVNYDAYYESYDLDAFVFEWNWSTFFDMVVYYVEPSAKGQMLTVFPYDCKERSPFDFQMNLKSSSGIKGRSEYDIIFIAPPDPSKPRILRVGHQRDNEAHPGIRFLVGNDTQVKKFNIYRGDEMIFSFPHLKDLTTDFYWFEPNDGPNLSFVIDDAMFKNRFVYRKGGLYNVVFTANKGKPITVMNVYYAEPPYTVHFLWALPQFVLVAIGELMFGMMGCQFFVEQTPQKFKYHTMLDWYWALAWSNMIILIVIYSGLFITFFFQIYWLSIMVLVSFAFFFYFTFRVPFVELQPGEKLKLPVPPLVPLPVDQEIKAMIPTVTVTVASEEAAPMEEPQPPPPETEPVVVMEPTT